ncbi:MAG: L-seryl-tRNA(Sec) selenium transferase [Actinomycetota bacterium]|nr:L-seryl-tRNA(Sec) selenium transferase [Actinomycetota bacterium]MED5397644.1 L-seryl-tRNA(Sec) selenium transferase [Actinomycetota bacterium]MEE3352573.1 L-seryl-tRNA(Sec) selenium transferase [Actinomycetota bacterium]
MSPSSDPPPQQRPPSVDRLARSLVDTGLPHPLLVDAARTAVAEATAAGDPASAGPRARMLAEDTARALLTDVVNASGVLLHTNLGRAPWSPPTGDDRRYTTLEFDLANGSRGSRQNRAPALLARACGAEAAMVVNNCASAVLLVLTALAAGRSVAVSRGELVEIGGGFRIPDVMDQSGARLIEVGTTNRTRIDDFSSALVSHSDVALTLSVHQSNYRIEGFTETASVADLADLKVPVVADIGSGLLDAACPWLEDGPPGWLAGEPAARQTLEAGAALVTFSGDKLLGGPQAGIIAGQADLIAACAAHPLARALRPGGLVLRSLQDLALAYLARDGRSIPFWRMATTPVDELRARAEQIAPELATDTVAVPGGGTLPGVEIPSAGLVLTGDRTAELRAGTPPLVARVANDATVLDLRTVHPEDDGLVATAIAELVPATTPSGPTTHDGA